MRVISSVPAPITISLAFDADCSFGVRRAVRFSPVVGLRVVVVTAHHALFVSLRWVEDIATGSDVWPGSGSAQDRGPVPIP